MKALTPERIVLLVFAIGLTILMVVGATAYRSAEQMVEEAAAAERALEVLAGVKAMQNALMEAEAAQRGHILTGEAARLQRYRESLGAAEAELERVTGIARDPAVLKRLRELREPLRRRADLLNAGVEAYRTGGIDAAAALIRAGDGYRLMAQVREQVTEIERRERRVLARRRLAVDRSAGRTRAVILLGTLFALLMVAGATLQLRHELTVRRRAERATRETASRLRAVLDSAVNGIVTVGVDGRIQDANPALQRIFGYSAHELQSREFLDLLDEPHRKPVAESMVQVQERSEQQVAGSTLEAVGLRRDGTEFPLELSVGRVDLRDRLLFIAIVRDITERREVERLKEEFVSVVSHELRTPLTSIRGALGLLASGKLGVLPDRGQRMLEVASQNTDRLVRLINDILDIERIQSAAVELDLQPVDAADLAAQAVEELRPLADRSGVAMELTTEPAPLLADPDRIIQLLTNLLSNAIKFSESGGRVDVRVRPESGRARIAVADQGRGIPVEKLETIFGRFQQVDASDSRTKGGTGLGLAISRGIARQHGGDIWAESEPGRGSTFHVVLPLASTPDVAAVRSTDRAAKVLLCDDDPSVLAVTRELLEGRGYYVSICQDPRAAVELAAAERPDVVLLDLLMPARSGWQVLAELKARPETRRIPVVLYSALAPNPAEPRAADAVAWVEKTSAAEVLERGVERALSLVPAASMVLVVEDDADLARVLCETFRARGLEALTAGTGKEAIDLCRRSPPDLLVLDLLLPDGDGYEVVEWLKRQDRLSDMPLVVYSALEPDAAARERLRLGETDVLVKGATSPEGVAERVLALLSRIA